MTDHRGVPSKFFHEIYQQTPAWEVGTPQPQVIRWLEAGRCTGHVLDFGCGTGENAFLLAQHGLKVTAFDLVPAAVEQARTKARERGLEVDFRVGDALKEVDWPIPFDTILDSGVFHVFSDDDRPRVVAGLRAALRPGGLLLILCFSELETSEVGPRRLTESELRSCFAEGFQLEELTRTRYASLAHPGGAQAWAAVFRRDG
ncbi:MAG TPA: methyltransferase domain-containing protein [Gemmatales bacterium]|nr:methyltransferase domain-containing protein [Gemmatales bacterium]HMP58993.1 methyltransferase domain-containing protein [Gemmatales bacterium]